MVHGIQVSENSVIGLSELRRDFFQLIRDAPRRPVLPAEDEGTGQDVFVTGVNVAAIVGVVIIVHRHKTGHSR